MPQHAPSPASKRARRRWPATAAAILATVALALPASAVAATEVEPNDGIHQAMGPLAAATNYDGATSANTDDDWYILYVSGQGNLDVTATNVTDAAGASVSFYLRNRDGDALNSTSVYDNQVEHLVYATPGAGEYYLEVVSGYAANKYRLRLAGPITSGQPTKPAQQTPNASRDAASAFGPLTGDTLYGGAIDAYGEYDWFYFYTAGGGPLQIALTNVPDDGGDSVSMYLVDEAGDTLNSTGAYENRISRIDYNAPGRLKLLLEVVGSSPVNKYQLKITPASALTGSPPPPPPPTTTTDPPPPAPTTPPPSGNPPASAEQQACARARSSRARAARRVRRAKSKLARAHRPSTRRKLKRSLKRYRKALRAADRRVSSACS
jgi:hypothetical protein